MYPLTLKGSSAVPTVCKFNNSYSLRHRYVGFVNLDPGYKASNGIPKYLGVFLRVGVGEGGGGGR